METCKDCIYLPMCYRLEHYGVDIDSDVFECKYFKSKAEFDKTIDDLITEIHCLEAKCRKLEEENEDLKISIEVRDDFINRQNEEIKKLENRYIFER